MAHKKRPNKVPTQKASASRPAQAQINAIVERMNSGQWATAELLAADLTQAFPGHPHSWTMLGVVLAQTGKIAESLKPLQKAVELTPGDAGAHCNLGNALRELGRFEEAKATYSRAISGNPNYPDAHNNLGNALRDLGRLQEAVTSYRRAITLKADFALAHSNLGTALSDLGRLKESEASYRRAIALNPGFAEAYSKLGNTLISLGRLPEAEVSCRKAISLNPHNIAAKSAYAQCISVMRFESINAAIYETTAVALSEAWITPSGLSGVTCNLLKLNPLIGKFLGSTDNPDLPALPVSEFFSGDLPEQFGNDSLLNALLTSATIYDEELEYLLTGIRHGFLENVVKSTGMMATGVAGITLFCSLAQQCFISEYLFSCTEEELKTATQLRDALISAVEDAHDISPLWIIAVACYFPLGSIAGAEKLIARSWPDVIAMLLTQQISEPLEERNLRASIPQLTPIDNGVSLEVQNQYEESPYPRWVKPPLAGEPVPMDAYLHRLFPDVDIVQAEHCLKPEILIAGCGTGQHSISTAQVIKGANLLAVDLSAASLSYAKRKTLEAGIGSIAYAQADILQLDTLGRTFDVIESCGVLHHLEKPLDGWRLLVSLLRPNGFMRLAFYSEIARRHVVKARVLLGREGYGSTPDDIRRARQYLREVDRMDTLGCAIRSTDFYSLSACRDLLFHVQEHRMTLDLIRNFIEEHGLTFLGFELDTSVSRAYKERFPDDRAATNLVNWHVFETENPDTFFGMYEFWLQKCP